MLRLTWNSFAASASTATRPSRPTSPVIRTRSSLRTFCLTSLMMMILLLPSKWSTVASGLDGSEISSNRGC